MEFPSISIKLPQTKWHIVNLRVSGSFGVASHSRAIFILMLCTLFNSSEVHAVQDVISKNLFQNRVCRLMTLPLYITKDVSWCFPVCLLQSVLANLFLQASFPQKLLCNSLAPCIYATRACHTECKYMFISLTGPEAQTVLWSPSLPASLMLHSLPFFCGTKAAHTLDFFASGKARAWSSFVLLAYRKLFFYCLTLMVYKMVKGRLQRPSMNAPPTEYLAC